MLFLWGTFYVIQFSVEFGILSSFFPHTGSRDL
jgi:hypothetical protein